MGAKVRELNRATSLDIRAAPGGRSGGCTEDIARLCKDVTPGEGRINRCLQDHLKEIQSPVCKFTQTALKNVAQKDFTLNPMLVKQCANEQKLFCPNVAAGEARLIGCLKIFQKRDSFGALCKKELDRFSSDITAESKRVAMTVIVGEVLEHQGA